MALITLRTAHYVISRFPSLSTLGRQKKGKKCKFERNLLLLWDFRMLRNIFDYLRLHV